MKMLQGGDAKTRITKFLAGESILLTSDEETILARWEVANDLLVKKEKTWVEIRDFIAMRFVVSKFTAENDICNAQEVFGTNRRINKRYLLHLHLDRMDKDIERIREGLFFWKNPKTGKREAITPDAKDIGALARLAQVYTFTINSIPDDIDRSKLPPPLYIFQLPPGVVINQPMTLNSAMQAADEYLDYEILDDGKNLQSPRSAGESKSDAGTTHDDSLGEGE